MNYTEKKSKSLGPTNSIEKPLREFENTYKGKILNSYNLGLEAENVVVKYFIQEGFKLIKQRWRSSFCEVDLIFEDPIDKSLLLVEVKKRSHSDFIEFMYGSNQKKRQNILLNQILEKGIKASFKLVILNKLNQIVKILDIFD